MTRATTTTARASHRWLDLIDAQSYGKTIGPVPVGFTAPPVPGLGDHEIALSWTAAGLLGTVRYPRQPGAEPVAGFWERAQALLYGAFGTLRHEPSHPFNGHRAYPSARCLFPVSAYVIGAGGAGRYDSDRHALRPVAGSPAYVAPTAGAIIALVGHYAAIPAGYGPLRFALTALEAGHALRAAVCCAEALALPHRIEVGFVDEAVLTRLGLPRDGGWAPLALLALGDDPPELGPAAGGSVAAASDELARLERASWKNAAAARAWRPRAQPTQTGARPPTAAVPAPRPLGEVLYARTSGRSTAGLSARPEPIPAALVEAAAAEAARTLLATGRLTGVRLLVVAERVHGLADGLHAIDLGSGAIALIRAGRCLSEVQRAFSYPAEVVNVRSLNLAWMLVVDYAAVLEEHGPRGLRWTQLELGWMAQGLASALAAGQVFARPVRSYHEAVLDQVLALPPRERVAYQLLCGRSRFTDAVFDLRPVAASRSEAP